MLKLQHTIFSGLTKLKKPITAVRYKMDHLDRTSANTREQGLYDCTVNELQDLSQTVKMLSLHVQGDKAMFKPGQWVDFFIPKVTTVGGFSMCSSPRLLQEKNIMHLAVKKSDHPPAAWVHNECKVGSKVQVRIGGDFYLSKENSTRPLLLLAGGVGINPLLSMLLYVSEQRSQSSLPSPVVLLYSTRTRSEQLFVEQIQDAMKRCAWIQFEQFVTREEAGDGLSRRIDSSIIDHTLQYYFLGCSNVLSFICGPSPFIDSMEEHLQKSGVAKQNILYEKWW